MRGRRIDRRNAACGRFALAAVVAVSLLATGPAQDDTPPPAAKPDEAEVRAAVEAWLAGDQAVPERDRVTKLLLDLPGGIAWFASLLPADLATSLEPRAKGLKMLLRTVTLGFVRRQRATDLTFQGQYDGLAPLRPHVVDFLFGLLSETPDWFPTTNRIHLVAPLRDLQPKLPTEERVWPLTRIVEDARFEDEGLRRALAALLWQWGRRQYAQAMIDSLMRATTEGDAEERVRTTLELADFHTSLREYKQAASAHRTAQALAKSSGVQLRPVAWYAASCVHALLGETERALAAMHQCVDLLASPHLDSSLRLKRSMFDDDPELAPLRAHPRWPELMQRAFPSAAKDAGKEGEGGKPAQGGR